MQFTIWFSGPAVNRHNTGQGPGHIRARVALVHPDQQTGYPGSEYMNLKMMKKTNKDAVFFYSFYKNCANFNHTHVNNNNNSIESMELQTKRI